MSRLINKLALIVGFSFLAITQSFASQAYPNIDVVGSGVYGWQNNRTLWCNSTTDASSTSLSASSLTNYNQLLVTGLVGVVSTAIIGPTIKARLIDPLFDRFSSNFGVPRCCRRQSSDDMDIVTDLFKPMPSKEYELLFRSLDAALSDEESGWNKYVVVDKRRLVVGYKYVLLNDEEKEKASISLIREYEGLENSKGLLFVNPDIRLDKVRDVTEIESIEDRELTQKSKGCYSYPTKLVKKGGAKSSRLSAAVLHVKSKKTLGKQVSPAPKIKDGKAERKDDDAHPADLALMRFTQSLLACASENIGRLIGQALNLHLKPVAELRINPEEWFAHLNMGSSIHNFNVYFSKEHDKP